MAEFPEYWVAGLYMSGIRLQKFRGDEKRKVKKHKRKEKIERRLRGCDMQRNLTSSGVNAEVYCLVEIQTKV